MSDEKTGPLPPLKRIPDMADFNPLTDEQLEEIYRASLISEVASLIDGERDYVINTANVASILYHGLKQVLPCLKSGL